MCSTDVQLLCKDVCVVFSLWGKNDISAIPHIFCFSCHVSMKGATAK